MQRCLFSILVLAIVSALVAPVIVQAEDVTFLKANVAIWDKGVFHVVQHKSSEPVIDIGLVGDRLLASVSADEHAWLFDQKFVAVHGSDPATSLGYPSYQNAKTLLKAPTKNACTGLKEVVSSVAITKTKNLCLTSTKGGDYVLVLMPEKKKISVGYGKKFILDIHGLTWIGYDGNVYQAFVHPDFFDGTMTVVKYKKAPTVYLVKNGMKFQLQDEKTFFSWFSSWKDVKEVDAKTLATYKLIGKLSYRQNALIKFAGEKELYVYQPKNDPYFTFGKDVKIVSEDAEVWVIQKSTSKTTEKMIKRAELLRHIISIDDVIRVYGPAWSKRLIELPLSLKSKFMISEKNFDPDTDVIVE